jgi:hypothetical protein
MEPIFDPSHRRIEMNVVTLRVPGIDQHQQSGMKIEM